MDTLIALGTLTAFGYSTYELLAEWGLPTSPYTRLVTGLDEEDGATEEQRTAAFESLRAARGKAGGWHHRRH